MFVFSRDQLKSLLSSADVVVGADPISVLDIGSGDGHVTDKIKEVLKTPTVHVTETSRVMQRVLKRRNYK